MKNIKNIKTILRGGLSAVLSLAAPGVALACPVCFGQNDSPLASAMNMGILVMLGVVVAVLGGFATFIVHLIRRARQAEQAAPLDAGRYLEGQKGTV